MHRQCHERQDTNYNKEHKETRIVIRNCLQSEPEDICDGCPRDADVHITGVFGR